MKLPEEDAVGLRRKVLAALLHRYPLFSGAGTIANHPIVKLLAPDKNALAWTKVGGKRVLCPLDDLCGRSAYYVGDLDPKISWLCKQLVRPGDTVIDIGANLGIVTVQLAALVGPKGRVHAFEPNPSVADLLEQTLSANEFVNVEVHRYALGEEDGALMLHVPRSNFGAASLVRTTSRGPLSHAVEVPVRTLSHFLATTSVGEIALVKIDVEGFELQVLRGGSTLFASAKPRAILFEHNAEEPLPATHPVFGLLNELGYSFFEIPKCLFRMRLRRYNPFAGQALRSNDLLAVPAGEVYEQTSRLLNATA